MEPYSCRILQLYLKIPIPTLDIWKPGRGGRFLLYKNSFSYRPVGVYTSYWKSFKRTPPGCRTSAIDKLKEFMVLGYPRGMLYDICTRMAVTTRSVAWFMIRGKIMRWYAILEPMKPGLGGFSLKFGWAGFS